MKKLFSVIAFIGIVAAGCTLAPRYQRPAAPVAQAWPDTAPQQTHGNNVVADLGWREFFQDPRLQALIGLALTNNRDLRVATLNVEASRAQYRIQRANLLPQIDATGNFARQKTPGYELFPGETAVNNQYTVGLGTTAYELDLFGRIRSLKSQALETYLATEEARRSVQISLVSEVAIQYLTELEYAEQLAVARRNLEAVQSACDLDRQSYQAGSLSGLDVQAAEAELEAARVTVANDEQLWNQGEDALVLLIGEPLPADLPPPQPLDAQRLLTDLPPGLPSDLLQRRPDILEAEHQLKAANANIGAARAAFFPSIKITADAGFSSQQLSRLFATGSDTWLFNPQITLPIFEAGQNKANLDLATLNKNIQVAGYEKAIQTAFREVSDALFAKKSLDEQLAAQERLVQNEQSRCDLSEARYQNGADSYLTVLAARGDLYGAQQNLAALRYLRLSNLVSLYQALGGGWRADTTPPDRDSH